MFWLYPGVYLKMNPDKFFFQFPKIWLAFRTKNQTKWTEQDARTIFVGDVQNDRLMNIWCLVSMGIWMNLDISSSIIQKRWPGGIPDIKVPTPQTCTKKSRARKSHWENDDFAGRNGFATSQRWVPSPALMWKSSERAPTKAPPTVSFFGSWEGVPHFPVDATKNTAGILWNWNVLVIATLKFPIPTKRDVFFQHPWFFSWSVFLAVFLLGFLSETETNLHLYSTRVGPIFSLFLQDQVVDHSGISWRFLRWSETWC